MDLIIALIFHKSGLGSLKSSLLKTILKNHQNRSMINQLQAPNHLTLLLTVGQFVTLINPIFYEWKSVGLEL